MTLPQTNYIHQVAVDADALVEIAEVLLNQKMYLTALRIGLGTRDFFQIAVVELSTHCYTAAMIGKQDLLDAVVIDYQEVDITSPSGDAELQHVKETIARFVMVYMNAE